jgi:hypothetical protein
VAGGCVGQATSGGDRPDAQGTIDARPGDARPTDAPAQFMCRNKITSGLDNGHHNAGQNCQQGCHDHNFSMSGTIYTSASGGTPAVGASITFIDANGMTGDMRSGLNGNFWWSLPVAFPVRIIASSCPDIQPMIAMVTATGGGCNQSGCHGGSGGPGRVHLP